MIFSLKIQLTNTFVQRVIVSFIPNPPCLHIVQSTQVNGQVDTVHSDNVRLQAIQYNLVMATSNDNLERVIAFPAYIFLSLLLAFLGGMGVRTFWLAGARGFAILSAMLIIAHISLYWLNYSRANKNTAWWFFYYPAQTALMLGVTLLLQAHLSNGLSFLFSATISIAGEALGVWGNSRRALWLGIFYFGLLFSLLFVLTERERFYSSFVAMLVNGGAIMLLMVMVNQQFIERRKAVELAESLESANAKLAATAAKIEALTLQNERQRMARELHDTLAQGVAGLVLQLEAVKAHLASNRNERASAIIEQALRRARSTLAESRAVIDDLRAVSTDAADSVRETVERFKQATGIPCEAEILVNGNPPSLETTSHTLNILSEALTNVARHAQATQVHIRFIVQNQTLELEVCDNGRGFDINQNRSGHYGLLGMHERARLTGGALAIESSAGGTRIRFSVGRS
jgi:two-component system, NarL family, sensor histidine kinase YdfH